MLEDDDLFKEEKKEVTDDTVMWFGKYKGLKVGEVPADYLMWCYENAVESETLGKYIRKHYRDLLQEIEDDREERDYRRW